MLQDKEEKEKKKKGERLRNGRRPSDYSELSSLLRHEDCKLYLPLEPKKVCRIGGQKEVDEDDWNTERREIAGKAE